MIEFCSVKMKNFQSVGNAGIKIDLNRSTTTLISGSNGAGKSNVLESVSYCLYGKSLKKVKLSGLINSTNKKNLSVECVFRKHGDEYTVIRGEKPKKFEIHKNGELLDQNANSKDYQAILEKILGMDYKLFSQIVLLNRERYVPFMDLSAADRRKVVEDILDINVFGYMNDVVKDKLKQVSNTINDVEYERGLVKTKIEGIERLIEQAQSQISDDVDTWRSDIESQKNVISQNESRISELKQTIDDEKAVKERQKKLTNKKSELIGYSETFKQKLKGYEKEESFYSENENCPTCEQAIDESFKDSAVEKLQTAKQEIRDASATLAEKASQIVTELSKANERLEEISDTKDQIRDLEREIDFANRSIRDLKGKIEKAEKSGVDQSIIDEKKEHETQLEKYDGQLKSAFTDKETYDTMKWMLKDDGIKATIVDDYVGFINKRMNEYLNQMGFFINITLDGNFNEQINSINRAGFTYDNLSTGQKARVSLSLHLVLLEIAQIKNSTTTNLLILDEILENIDQDGVSLFMGLVREKLSHKNVFVISQRQEEFKDHFRSELAFELDDEGFTKLSA